jgi:hypothetical protein
VTSSQALAVDHCNIKTNKHFTADMPAVLRQLQVDAEASRLVFDK